MRDRLKMSGPSKRRKRWVLMWAQACVCPACGRLMDPDAKWSDPDYPTLDHVQPQSAGGVHAIANLLVKHRVCNELRADAPATASDRAAQEIVEERLQGRPALVSECKAAARAIFAASSTPRRRAA